MSAPYNYSVYQPQQSEPRYSQMEPYNVLTGSFGYDRDGDGVPLR